MNEIHPYAIVGIEVEGLFGYINQRLLTDRGNRDKISRLAILYGENGTGKTTLLRLAFHLLSPRTDRGHKTWIAATPFKSLSITLRDGTRVQATREEARVGDYTFSVKCPRKRVLTHHIKAKTNSTIEPYDFSPELQQALLDRASSVFFLRDDRLIEVEISVEAPSLWEELFADVHRRAKGRKIDRPEEEMYWRREQTDLLGAALRISIIRLNRWFSIQYGQKTNMGMASSHAIYEEVIARVTSADRPQRTPKSLKPLINQLLKLSLESTVFESYGLSTRMNVDSIVQSLENADKDQIRTLYPLLAPYVDTVKARFAELREIFKTIDTFVRIVNRFMSPKQVTYLISEGLRIYSPQGQQISPTDLSSGEKHLFLILTSAVLARSHRTIFIIDEPEISLNTTWQRELAGALLAVSKNSLNQFVLASHSLPLITPYRDHVLRLQQEDRHEP